MPDENDADSQIPSMPEIACHACGRLNDLSACRAFSTTQCSHCGASIPVPGKLGNFVLLRVLRRDGVSTTYQAHDDLLGRQVAVRVLRPDLADNKPRVKAFGAEARALASLNHPNVAHVYSLNIRKRPHYVARELTPTRHLGHLFTKAEPLDEVRALDIAIQVVEALKAAQGVGLIHGHLKPDSLPLDRDGAVRLARFRSADAPAEPGEADGIVGAPYYISPEQVLRKPIDHRADIYSLAATLFHALTGRPPFRGKDAETVLRAHLERPARKARDVRPALHRATSALLAKMLEPNPDDRYPTHDALLADLREARTAATKPETPAPGVSKNLELARAALRDWRRGRKAQARAEKQKKFVPVAEPAPDEPPKSAPAPPSVEPSAPPRVERPAPTPPAPEAPPAARDEAPPAPQPGEAEPAEPVEVAPLTEEELAEDIEEDLEEAPPAPETSPPPGRAHRRVRMVLVSISLLGVGGGLLATPYLIPRSPRSDSQPGGIFETPAPPVAPPHRRPAPTPPAPANLPDPGPVPPLPDVYVSDFKLAKDTVASGKKPQKNRNIEGRPLNVNGKEYKKGLGVRARSVLVFPRRAGHKRFVAVVGIDGMNQPAPERASIVCEIHAGRRVIKSPVLRWRGRRHWHFNVQLPPKCRNVRLVVADAGDGPQADLANWVNAGFKKR